MAATTTTGRLAAISARLALVDDTAALSEGTAKAMAQIIALLSKTANDMVSIAEAAGGYDVGRLIAALDHLQQTKNIALDALRLPQVNNKKA